MKSIGDFALNIIPNIDTIKLNTGIIALDSLTNLASKVFDGFKKAYNVVDDTADSLLNLSYASRELNMPVQQIDLMRKTMRLFNLDANQASEAIKSIAKFKGGAIFGEIPSDLIMKAGITPQMFGNDPIKNLLLLSRVYQANTNVNARAALNQIFGAAIEPMLAVPTQQLKSFLDTARKGGLISEKDLAGVTAYEMEKGRFSNALENLSVALTNSALPGLTQAINGLVEVLNSPITKQIFNTIGSVMGFTGSVLGGSGKELILGKGQEMQKSMMAQPGMLGGGVPVPIVVEIHNTSDGTSIDTKIKQSQTQKNREMQQSNLNKSKVGQ